MHCIGAQGRACAMLYKCAKEIFPEITRNRVAVKILFIFFTRVFAINYAPLVTGL